MYVCVCVCVCVCVFRCISVHFHCFGKIKQSNKKLEEAGAAVVFLFLLQRLNAL